MLPAPLVESLSVGSHETVGGGQHRGVWGLRPLSGKGNNSANGSQTAGVCVDTRMAGKYLHGPNLVLPGGNKGSQCGFLRERQQILREKEHMLLSPGLQGNTKSLSLEAATEQGATPHPTEHLLQMI